LGLVLDRGTVIDESALSIPSSQPMPQECEDERVDASGTLRWVGRSRSLPNGDRAWGAISSTKELPDLSADHLGGDIAMTITALLVSVGVGTCAFAEGPSKAPPVAIAGTVVGADRQPRRASAGTGSPTGSCTSGSSAMKMLSETADQQPDEREIHS
jgi:hypothetical protein